MSWRLVHQSEAERVLAHGSGPLPRPGEDPDAWRPPGGPWLTAREFADRTGCTPGRLQSVIRAGELDCVVVVRGRRRLRLVHEREVARFRARRRAARAA